MIEDKKQDVNSLIKNAKNKNSFWSLLKTAFLFIALFFIIRLFIFAPFIVWGASINKIKN